MILIDIAKYICFYNRLFHLVPCGENASTLEALAEKCMKPGVPRHSSANKFLQFSQAQQQQQGLSDLLGKLRILMSSEA